MKTQACPSNATSLMLGLALALGLPDLSLDESDSCTLELVPGLPVDLHAVEALDALCLCVEVGPLGAGMRTATLRRLLEANLTRDGLGHAHLALSEAGDAVLLCRTLPLQAQTAHTLIHEMHLLVDLCRQWRARLGQLAALAPALVN